LSVISTMGRKEIIPNPFPDIFYSGSTELVPEYGLRENYFAWEWGDALFVFLDPFWPTTRKPFGVYGSFDGWDWTYGKEQYDWLYTTLNESDARWKFVFTHHLTSTYTEPFWYPYGRGGIEVAKFKVDGQPSFEWGGEDETGEDVFSAKRPGWSHGPIHDMLVSQNVTVVFHGHDHFFARQDLDGIVYLECPGATYENYGWGFRNDGNYKYGTFHRNSGHVRVTVDGTDSVQLDYVRAFLPGDGTNGEIADSFTIE